MSYLSTDQYTHVRRDCPVSVDVHPADDVVEVAIGEHQDTLRLIIDDPDTCTRLAQALHDARDHVTHLRART